MAFTYSRNRALAYALDERTPWLLRSLAWDLNRSRRQSLAYWLL